MESEETLYWHLKNQDVAVADYATAMKKGGRPEWADASTAGYQKAKLKGAMHSDD